MQPTQTSGFITVSDVKRVMKVAQLEKVKARFRDVNRNTVSYNEFTMICVDACCGNEAQGLEFAKLLDEAGNVLVFGNIVFLQPEQVVKSVEHLISESINMPNEQRDEELEQLERQKIDIDRKSHMQVRQELYGGLAFLMIQTIGFMRLTFWELSWDVMEPICFFVTSLHFALAYGFFLHTSTEPSFQGYYQCRFRAKQSKLIKAQNFDIGKYSRLMKALRPNQPDNISTYKYSPSYV